MDQTITDPNEISLAFTTHLSFGTRGPSVDLESTEGLGTYTSLHVDLGGFIEAGVRAAIRRMKPKRGQGPDGVPAYICKACKDLLAEPLTHIFNVIS